jgi:hypothetical protein
MTGSELDSWRIVAWVWSIFMGLKLAQALLTNVLQGSDGGSSHRQTEPLKLFWLNFTLGASSLVVSLWYVISK